MKVFIAGATGAIGKCLAPELIASRYEVVGTTRHAHKAQLLKSIGAEGIVLDALDRAAVRSAVERTRPDVIVNELTAIPPKVDFRHFDRQFAMTNRLRTEGTAHLLDAAVRVGVPRFIAQSFAGWPYQREGGPVKREEDPLDSNPPKGLASTLAAIKSLENQVTKTAGIEGVVLRYGFFYGPPSIVGPGISDMMAMLRRRKFPIVGNGTGVWSFVHINDAARATQAAVKQALPGVYNIVDDDPARVADWLPELARIAGGPEPRHVPKWVAKFLIGHVGVLFMTEIRGASNEKAKQSLDWRPIYSSWRIGFQKGLGSEKPYPASQLAS